MSLCDFLGDQQAEAEFQVFQSEFSEAGENASDALVIVLGTLQVSVALHHLVAASNQTRILVQQLHTEEVQHDGIGSQQARAYAAVFQAGVYLLNLSGRQRMRPLVELTRLARGE